MSEGKTRVIVVGCGMGGLASAVSALQHGAEVTILERAPQEERGGQTRYTEAYFRMKSESEVTDDFETHLAENGSGYLDPSLVSLTASGARDSWPQVVKGLSLTDPDFIGSFAEQAGPTVAWLKTFSVRFDFLPTQFLTKSQPRLLPVGGGLALVEALAAEAERRGARMLYETTATGLLIGDDGRVGGVHCRSAGKPLTLQADAVVLACGGFEGNAEMMTRYIGPRSVYLRPICRGGYFNKGEGIRMALDAGAATAGDFGSYHAEPIDPRSGISEPSVFIFPYGILVNLDGERFTDEAPGTVDAHYERVTRRIYEQRNGLAYVVLDARHMQIPNYRLGIRTDQPPLVGDTVAALAEACGVSAVGLTRTVEAYNAACRPGDYNPLAVDGVCTQGLEPRKSNWALPIDTPPYHAYPIISANVFTFGGLKVDAHARVLDSDGAPIPGLYAAGEIIGTYYHTYTGATSVLKGAVFGRAAGRHATGNAA